MKDDSSEMISGRWPCVPVSERGTWDWFAPFLTESLLTNENATDDSLFALPHWWQNYHRATSAFRSYFGKYNCYSPEHVQRFSKVFGEIDEASF